jgi:hypothetical protein
VFAELFEIMICPRQRAVSNRTNFFQCISCGRENTGFGRILEASRVVGIMYRDPSWRTGSVLPSSSWTIEVKTEKNVGKL